MNGKLVWKEWTISVRPTVNIGKLLETLYESDTILNIEMVTTALLLLPLMIKTLQTITVTYNELDTSKLTIMSTLINNSYH